MLRISRRLVQTHENTDQKNFKYRHFSRSDPLFTFNNTRQEKIPRNRQILKKVIKAVILCWKICIVFREHRENIKDSGNYEDFLGILKLLSEEISDFMEDLNKPSAKNKKYISPQNQNELIEVISFDILKNDLIKEIKDAMFYATNRWGEEIVMKLWELKKNPI